MTEPIDRENFEARIRVVLEHAVAQLSEEEFAKRVAWCHQTGQYGMRMIPHGPVIEIV